MKIQKAPPYHPPQAEIILIQPDYIITTSTSREEESTLGEWDTEM